jgi:hypothetical protein
LIKINNPNTEPEYSLTKTCYGQAADVCVIFKKQRHVMIAYCGIDCFKCEKIFKVWSKFILKKGKRGDLARKFRVRLFLVYLFAAIAVIAPVSTVLSMVAAKFKKDEIKNAMDYFSKNIV